MKKILIGLFGLILCSVASAATSSMIDRNQFRVLEPSGSDKITISAPALSAGYSFTLPNSAGSNTQVLSTNGSGTLSWVSNAAGIGDTITSGTAGSVLYVGSGPVFAQTAVGTTGYYLTSGGAGAATWTNPNLPYLAKTANYNVDPADNFIAVDTTSGAVTLTLPTAVGVAGKVYHFKLATRVNLLTIATTSSQTIDGITTLKMNAKDDDVILASDGANWKILSSNIAVVVTGIGSSTSFSTGITTLVPTTVTDDSTQCMSSGVCTVMTAGNYLLSATCIASASITYIALYYKINSDTAVSIAQQVATVASSNMGPAGTAIVKLAVGDTIAVQAAASGTSSCNTSYVYSLVKVH